MNLWKPTVQTLTQDCKLRKHVRTFSWRSSCFCPFYSVFIVFLCFFYIAFIMFLCFYIVFVIFIVNNLLIIVRSSIFMFGWKRTPAEKSHGTRYTALKKSSLNIQTICVPCTVVKFGIFRLLNFRFCFQNQSAPRRTRGRGVPTPPPPVHCCDGLWQLTIATLDRGVRGDAQHWTGGGGLVLIIVNNLMY